MTMYRLASLRTIFFAFCTMLLPFGMWVPDVQATCVINVKVKNMGKARLSVMNVTSHSAVKVKRGLWKPLKQGMWFGQTDRFGLDSGETKGDNYMATFKCKAERRYRIYYICLSGVNKDKPFVDYYPSSATWTTFQTFTISLRQCN